MFKQVKIKVIFSRTLCQRSTHIIKITCENILVWDYLVSIYFELKLIFKITYVFVNRPDSCTTNCWPCVSKQQTKGNKTNNFVYICWLISLNTSLFFLRLVKLYYKVQIIRSLILNHLTVKDGKSKNVLQFLTIVHD